MPVIGATQLEPVNVLGSYVQGMELGRANRLAQQQQAAQMEAARQEVELRNYLSTADLESPEAQNQLLRFGAPGATLAKTLGEMRNADLTRQKTMTEIEAAGMKRQRDLLAAVNDQPTYDMWRRGALETYKGVPGAEQLIPAKFSPETKERLLLTADQIVGRMPMSPEQEAQKTRIAAAGASRTIIPPAETERSKTVGKLGGEALVNEFNVAQNAARGLAKDYEAIKVLREGKPSTGITSEIETSFNRIRSAVANDPEAAAKVSDSQYLEALLGSDVFQQMSALGVGARGLDTPAEREFLREVISGTRKLDKSTLIRMAELRAKYKEELVQDYNSRIESGELDKFFEDFGRPKKPFKLPERPVSEAPVTVNVPGRGPVTFPNKKAADDFKKAAGIK
jgi:hypothetical protein